MVARTPDTSGKTGSEDLARTIRERREQLGLTRQELADATQIPYPTLAQIETAYRGVSPARLGTIARVLSLDPKELYDLLTSQGSTGAGDSDGGEAAGSWHQNPRFVAALAAPAPVPEPPAVRETDHVVGEVVRLLRTVPAEDRISTLSRIQIRVLEEIVVERTRSAEK